MNRILVVDDDEAIRLLYSDELEEEGYDVIATGDAWKTADLIETHQPDLVVLDIRLGETNGMDLLQDIRNRHYNLPVVLCTAYPLFKRDMRAMAADHYVIKSPDLSELKDKVRMAMKANMAFIDQWAA